MAVATYFSDYFTLQSRRLVIEKGGQCTIISLLPTQLLSLRITSLSFRLRPLSAVTTSDHLT